MTFLGEILDKRLLSVMETSQLFVLHVVKKVLEDEFLKAYHHYKVNVDIPTMFLV